MQEVKKWGRKMPSYNYIAIQKDGRKKRGTMEAVNEEAAKVALKSEGLIPISLSALTIWNKELDINFTSKVKSRDLSVFCRQFSSILESGITVVNALHILYDQTENKVFQKAIWDVSVEVEKGTTLAEAMRGQEKIFPSILINMVEAGETSGSLENAFLRMAVHFEKDAKLKGVIAKALVYPVILIIVVIAVVIVMMAKIIPQFMETFEEMDMELPKVTQAVIRISSFVQYNWIYIIGILGLIVAGIRALKRTERGSVLYGRILLKIPLFGKLIIKSASARLARVLSTLIGTGISLVDAVDIISKIMDNKIICQVLVKAKEDVAQGIPLSKVLEVSGVFPPMVYHMMKIGEETGNMEEMLDNVADYYEEEVELATGALTAVLEPIIIILMACIIVPIILAMMLPMLNVYKGIN